TPTRSVGRAAVLGPGSVAFPRRSVGTRARAPTCTCSGLFPLVPTLQRGNAQRMLRAKWRLPALLRGTSTETVNGSQAAKYSKLRIYVPMNPRYCKKLRLVKTFSRKESPNPGGTMELPKTKIVC